MIDWSSVGVLITRAYRVLEEFIASLLADALFKTRPELASQFSGPLSLLVSLTALYLLLTLVTAAKRVIGAILIIGWALLMAAIALTVAMPSP